MTENIESANTFRELVHREQQTVIKNLSLGRIVNAIFSKGDLQEICDVLLHSLKDVLNLQHSVVVISENAFLTIVATIGKSYPIGARVPKIASLAEVLKSGCHFDIHSIQTNQLFMLGESESLVAFAIPLGVGGQIFGLLAYCSTQAISEEHLPYLQMVASILSLSLQKNNGRSHKGDHKILAQITPREREVLSLLPKGYTNSEIAEILGIASDPTDRRRYAVRHERQTKGGDGTSVKVRRLH